MALAGDEQAFAGLLPARLLQQLLAQGLQAFAGAGRQSQALAFGLDGGGIGLVPHVNHRHTCRQAAL